MTTTSRRWGRLVARAIATAAALITAISLTGGLSPVHAAADEIPARVVTIDPPTSSGTYSGIDYGRSASPRDDRHSRTAWRVVERTGNCCENYLTITADGRLLDFGGSHINFSDDRGRTWRQAQPLTPLHNGEGAIVAAPGGDVLGVQWDPYTGDHVQFYKYEADTAQWLYTEMPVHQPFYDREWISVVPGPVTIDGQTHDYVSFVKGGYPTKELWHLSTDGLHYTNVTSKMVDQITNGRTVVGPLGTAAGAVNDWAQPNTNGGMTALGGGASLASPDSGSEWGLFGGGADNRDASWAAYRLPDGSQPKGRFQVDSAGRVHNMRPAAGQDGFDYRISADGGRTWKSTRVALPDGHTIEEIDFRAHGAAGVAAVAMRAQGPEADQDLVYKLDITSDAPRVSRMYRVGLGDVDATGGAGNDVRFDFESVAIFDDGRVAVSFMDSTTTLPSSTNPERNSPAIAVEGDTTLGGNVPVEPVDPPQLGEPYASYDFEADAQDWSAGGAPTWSRSAPGMASGADDPSGFGFGLEGPTQYADNVDATLTSPSVSAPAGDTVLEFWLKSDTEEGFDGVSAEWSVDGANWRPAGGMYSGRNAGYPDWQKVTLGFTSPGGPVQVRFRFTSDLMCSALTPACGEFTGARVDHVTVGSQA